MRIQLISVLCLLVAAPAFAAGENPTSHSHRDSFRHTSAAPDYGYSSNLAAVGVSDTTNITAGETLTALFSVGQNWIQTYLGVYQSRGDFDFAMGGVYKFTVAGNRATGFHVGPGFTIGTQHDDFAFAVFGAAGGHFTFADHLMFSVDGGPLVTHTKNNTNLRIRGLGSLLGLSVAYVF